MSALSVYNNYHPDVLTRFNNDVTEHEMTALLDQGVYRHLRFKDPMTSMGWFDLITSPGQLTIRGDMGTYVFARLTDMFEFFTGNGYVNAGYWGEKLQAVDTSGGYREHDEELFKKFIVEDFWERRQDYEADTAAAIWEELRGTMFDDWEDRSSTAACHELMNRFRSHDFTYTDSWERNWDDYSYRYLWCCHAILWGIRQYRALEAAKVLGS